VAHFIDVIHGMDRPIRQSGGFENGGGVEREYYAGIYLGR